MIAQEQIENNASGTDEDQHKKHLGHWTGGATYPWVPNTLTWDI